MASQDNCTAGHLLCNEDTCELVPFPLSKRIGKIRGIAAKLLDRKSARHAEYYQQQVTEALVGQLRKIGLPQHLLDKEIREFWSGVEQEMNRTTPSSPHVEPLR
ncbi:MULTISPECIES: DUF6074 family protein [Sinorhizobium]|uniref:DUF6074 family protein n=1 Tax=Sinorhizobium TaxID=28105 RepID=UPI0001E4A6DC|nr:MULTISPECIES: DUF6074 family protein [Sinorhizobium]AEG51909.1 hypothetical protein Sinme_0137 [Sinorhizobium meliloti AK83]MDE4592374.1 DUF6074 family protein [Sinorhizobium meliloti]RVJ73067.1 hypothetical protein CN168_25990 [Sinorhizobium medicae]SEJ26080.1 hypothetical protein SAMN04244575_03681 [Sinorhizobium meliloti]